MKKHGCFANLGNETQSDKSKKTSKVAQRTNAPSRADGDQEASTVIMVERARTERPARGTEYAMKPRDVAGRYRVGVAKVHGWIKRGELRAVNVASDLNKRPQWAITAEAMAEFETRRASQPTPKTPQRRKSKNNVKDYF